MINDYEKEFIKEFIRNKTRLDTRELLEKRIINKRNLNCLEYEKSYIFSKNKSKVEIFLKFETNDVFYNQFKEKDIITHPQIISNYEFPFKIDEIFKSFLEETKLTVKLDINVIVDDGSVLSLIFNGLKDIFTQIEVPFFIPHYKVNRIDYKLPDCYEFALFNDTFIMDPTKCEEISSDGLLIIIKENENIKKIILREGKSISFTKLDQFFKEIQNKVF